MGKAFNSIKQGLSEAIAHAKTLRSNYSDMRLYARLMQVLTERHGHLMAHEVEQAKIRCSVNGAKTGIDLSVIEQGLHAQLSVNDMQAQLQDCVDLVASIILDVFEAIDIPRV